MLITTGSQKDKLAIKLIPQMQHMNRQRSHSILRTNLPRFRPKTPSRAQDPVGRHIPFREN